MRVGQRGNTKGPRGRVKNGGECSRRRQGRSARGGALFVVVCILNCAAVNWGQMREEGWEVGGQGDRERRAGIEVGGQGEEGLERAGKATILQWKHIGSSH